MQRFGAAALVVFMAAAQMAARPQQPPAPREPEPAKQAVEPAPAALAEAPPAAVDPRTYIIGPEDILLIRVWREPEHSGLVTVRPDGKITLPLIGDIQAAGLTPDKLDAEVTNALAKYINNPDVIVSVQAVRSKRYYVTGEVNRPGAYPLVTPVTVLEALTLAGGFRDFANKKNITILRGNQRFRFNYNDVIKGKNLSQNIVLQHGDYIIVP
ncbi:MAG: polysaccharide biosynthesis/export family protein [Bryobacterales bacterium]|nr:polysaccharide biosynthesis/export family protein [Bryobacteraceae bacterium]MDW8129784.1 polysaccharide biosynthesis/export family protein [Bryobacterales bacterium]